MPRATFGYFFCKSQHSRWDCGVTGLVNVCVCVCLVTYSERLVRPAKPLSGEYCSGIKFQEFSNYFSFTVDKHHIIAVAGKKYQIHWSGPANQPNPGTCSPHVIPPSPVVQSGEYRHPYSFWVYVRVLCVAGVWWTFCTRKHLPGNAFEVLFPGKTMA